VSAVLKATAGTVCGAAGIMEIDFNHGDYISKQFYYLSVVSYI